MAPAAPYITRKPKRVQKRRFMNFSRNINFRFYSPLVLVGRAEGGLGFGNVVYTSPAAYREIDSRRRFYPPAQASPGPETSNILTPTPIQIQTAQDVAIQCNTQLTHSPVLRPIPAAALPALSLQLGMATNGRRAETRELPVIKNVTPAGGQSKGNGQLAPQRRNNRYNTISHKRRVTQVEVSEKHY
jgi:hypothetical protein